MHPYVESSTPNSNTMKTNAPFSNTAEKEIEIIHGLAQQILQYENTLNDASDMCGKLDRYCIGCQRFVAVY